MGQSISIADNFRCFITDAADGGLTGVNEFFSTGRKLAVVVVGKIILSGGVNFLCGIAGNIIADAVVVGVIVVDDCDDEVKMGDDDNSAVVYVAGDINISILVMDIAFVFVLSFVSLSLSLLTTTTRFISSLSFIVSPNNSESKDCELKKMRQQKTKDRNTEFRIIFS